MANSINLLELRIDSVEKCFIQSIQRLTSTKMLLDTLVRGDKCDYVSLNPSIVSKRHAAEWQMVMLQNALHFSTVIA